MLKYCKMIDHLNHQFSTDTETSSESESSDDDPEQPPASEETINNIVTLVKKKTAGGIERAYLTEKTLYKDNIQVVAYAHSDDNYSKKPRAVSLWIREAACSDDNPDADDTPEDVRYVVYEGLEIRRQVHGEDEDLYFDVTEIEAKSLLELVQTAKPHEKNKYF